MIVEAKDYFQGSVRINITYLMSKRFLCAINDKNSLILCVVPLDMCNVRKFLFVRYFFIYQSQVEI